MYHCALYINSFVTFFSLVGSFIPLVFALIFLFFVCLINFALYMLAQGIFIKPAGFALNDRRKNGAKAFYTARRLRFDILRLRQRLFLVLRNLVVSYDVPDKDLTPLCWLSHCTCVCIDSSPLAEE